MLLIFVKASTCAVQGSRVWNAGVCDSTLCLDAQHLKTVAVDMKFLDNDTYMPVRGIPVSMRKMHWEAWLSESSADAWSFPGWDMPADSEIRHYQRSLQKCPQCRRPIAGEAVLKMKGIPANMAQVISDGEL